MTKYIVQVAENINHSYLIDASSEAEAMEIFQNFDDAQLKDLDEDGQSGWDSPWDISETEDED